MRDGNSPGTARAVPHAPSAAPRTAVTALTVSSERGNVTDDESETWPDPPGSTTEASDESTIVGPLTFPDAVFGVHALVAAALVPFLWGALQEGNLPLVGSLGLLIGLLLVTGVTMRRIAARR